MLLTVFLTLGGLSLVLVTLGLAAPAHGELTIVGLVFLILLSLVLINGNLEVKTGEVSTVTYSYNGSTLISTSENMTNQTTPVSGTMPYGIPMGLMGGIGIAIYLFTLKSGVDDEE